MSADQFPARVRFNWGYHDASLDIRSGWKSRLTVEVTAIYDGVYRAPLPATGPYRAGYEMAMAIRDRGETLPDTSTAAWTEALGSGKAVA